MRPDRRQLLLAKIQLAAIRWGCAKLALTIVLALLTGPDNMG